MALGAGIVVACVLQQQLAVTIWTSVRRYIHSGHADFYTLVERHDDHTLALGLQTMYMSRSKRQTVERRRSLEVARNHYASNKFQNHDAVATDPSYRAILAHIFSTVTSSRDISGSGLVFPITETDVNEKGERTLTDCLKRIYKALGASLSI